MRRAETARRQMDVDLVGLLSRCPLGVVRNYADVVMPIAGRRANNAEPTASRSPVIASGRPTHALGRIRGGC